VFNDLRQGQAVHQYLFEQACKRLVEIFYSQHQHIPSNGGIWNFVLATDSIYMHSNSHNTDSVSMKYGCIFAIRHLFSCAEVGVFLYNLLVLSQVLQLPPLAVDGAVDGVVDAVSCFDCIQFCLHFRVQRLQSQQGQTKSSICPLSFLLRTMLLHRQPHCFVLWLPTVWQTGDSALDESLTAWFFVMTSRGDHTPAPTSTFAWHP